MFTKVKQSLKKNQDKIVIAGLSVVTCGLAYYALQQKKNYEFEYDNMQSLLMGLDAGYTPEIDWDAQLVKMTAPEPEKPKAPKPAKTRSAAEVS